MMATIDELRLDLADILAGLLVEDVPGGDEAFPPFVWCLRHGSSYHTSVVDGVVGLTCFESEGTAGFTQRRYEQQSEIVEMTFDDAREVAKSATSPLMDCIVLADRFDQVCWVR